LRSFPGLGKENSFTEAVALLFETRPQICLAWLKEEGLIKRLDAQDVAWESCDVVTQKRFRALENHGNKDSQVDLFIRTHRFLAENPGANDTVPDVVMVESKIESKERDGQLRRYAEHLERMPNVGSKMLVYITRGHDPKDEVDTCFGLEGVCFKQLRWHDFYRFLSALDKGDGDSLIKELMAFMEEETGMAGSGMFSVMDLMALSGIQRALEIIDETLDEEIRGELGSLVGHTTGKFTSGDFVQQIRDDNGYWIYADITQDQGFGCFLGYQMGTPDGSPRSEIGFWSDPNVLGKEVAVAAVKQISNRDGWQRTDVDELEPSEYEVQRDASLATFLQKDDHVAAVKEFFIDSIRQLREELVTFKKEHPDLSWTGEQGLSEEP